MTKGKIYQLSRYGNLLIVNAAVRGKNHQIRQIKLLVDTGSSYTVIRSTLLKSIGYDSEFLCKDLANSRTFCCFSGGKVLILCKIWS
jgi:aspartyl protease family protein